MTLPLTANDLWPVVTKLPQDEQLRLAKMALAAAAAPNSDAQAYRAMPVGAAEFADETDALGWDADGWEGR